MCVSGSGSGAVFCCPPNATAESSRNLSPVLRDFPAAQMYRAPLRPQRSPGAPRPALRFPSSPSCWGFPGARSPFRGSGHRGGSPQGGPVYSPSPPLYSPGSTRGFRNGSPAGLGSGSRGFGGQAWRRGGGFRRPHSFSPASAHNFQGASSDSAVEKYFSPSMLQDPWAALQPVAVADRHTAAS